MKCVARAAAWFLVLAVSSAPAWATNGMYLAGYGTEANGRGGANIAVADRALGVQANPAGIGQLAGNHFSVDFQMLAPQLHFSDPNGNDIDGEDQVFVMPSISYARGGTESKWAWGIALVSQGGMGADFRGYRTGFGTNDVFASQVRFVRLIPTGVFSFTPNISIGLSANLGYSDVQFRLWPGTSAPPNFLGISLVEPASTFNYSFRAGLMWRINSMWQVGAVYETKTQGDYENGRLRVNQTNLGVPGLGFVDYDAAVDGFTWPEQWGIGFQVRPGKKWMLAGDVKRYNWSDAVSIISVRATNPSDPASPIAEPQLPPFFFLWEDQWVYALGAEHRFNDTYTLRFGLNHGDSPVPDATMSPLFPATVEDHATLGLGFNVSRYTVNFALEHAFENTQTNPTMDPMVNPFGPGATVDHSQWTFSFGFSMAFSRKQRS